MSSLRGSGRGSARGFSAPSGPATGRQPRPGFQRGRGQSTTTRGTTRGAMTRGVRGRAGRGQGQPQSQMQVQAPTTGDYNSRFQQLKTRRETERKDAIRDGFLADPDRPRTLAEAITPTGTCPDMCAEFERLERIVQKDVWGQETREDGTPDEARMVKKFRRAAAGIDEQLPSDLRPPQTLRKTCDYLFDELIGNAESLASVHHFVWDRTRAIRNDFSIQQITKPADVEIAIECYERIARFHILSLHQFAVQEKPYDKYDWYQEREQLDRTLLSLMQYYEDNRDRVNVKNEAEFRAYCIIFQIQDPIPDLEDRVSCYPHHIKTHPRVRTSLDLYAAACNILDPQGPLKPRGPHPIAREDWNAFFKKVESNQVSYLMACVAEIYFNMIRKQTLNAIWRSFRRQGNSADITDFTLDYLTDLLRFDDFDQTRDFCEHYSFGFKETADGQDEYLDLNSVQGKTFPDAAQGLSAQIFSQSVVENKRLGRSFSAVIGGKSFGVARAEGQVVEEEGMGIEGDMQMEDDGESLFVPMGKQGQQGHGSGFSRGGANGMSNSFQTGGTISAANPFQKTTTTPAANPFQSTQTSSSNPFQSTTNSSNPFSKPPQNDGAATPPGSPFATKKPGLQDSVFARPAAPSSPFAFGKPSTSSSWSTPVAAGSATGNAKNASVFGQPTQPVASTQDHAQQAPKPASQPGFTSMHATSGFSWSKPSTSTWSTPISAAHTNTENTNQTSSTPSNSTESVSSKPPPQSPSMFSFAQASQPDASSSQQKALPTFNFAKPATEQAAKPAEETPKSTFGFLSAGNEEKSKSTGQSSPFASVDKPAGNSGFKSAQPSGQAQETPKPAFSFPTAQASSSTPQAGEPKSKPPLFSFTPQSAPPPEEIPRPSAQSSEQSSKSVFESSNSTLSDTPPSKPFTFAPINQEAKNPPPQPKPAPQPSPYSQPQSQPPAQQQKSPPSIPRSPSFSNPNQPKKRSPLSQSFTAEDQSAKSSTPSINFDTPPKRASFSPAPQPSFKAPPSSTPASKHADSQAVLTRLATEIVTDPGHGLIKQFIEHHAEPIIMSVYAQLYAEEMRSLADNFRREKLAKRYGRRWRETTWRLRLARQGREKREKRRTARRDRPTADEAKRRKVEINAVDDFLKRQSVRVQEESTKGRSPPPSFAATSRRSSVASQPTVGIGIAASAPNRAGRASTMVNGNDSKAPRVDGTARIIKPSTPASSVESSARKSHFLGFSVPKQRSILGGDTPRQSSRSAYFRMKALGLNPNGATVSTPMGPPPLNLKKRAREDDEADLEDASPPPKKSRTPPQDMMRPPSRLRSSSNVSQSSVLDLSPGASTVASTRMSHIDAGEDDILARARAARQAFRDSTRSHRSKVRPQDTMSVVSQEATPVRSVQHARFRAAERAEQNLAQSVMRPDVPAYRFRESRFVPREKYGLAIEKAKENLERRSRAGSVASAREQSLKPADDSGETRPGSAMSARDEPTRFVDQPVEEDVEMSQPHETSRAPSVRSPSKDTVLDEVPASQQQDQQQEEPAPAPEPAEARQQLPEPLQPPTQHVEIPAYQPPPQPPSIRFGFGQYQPPQTSGFGQYQPPQSSGFGTSGWSFRALNSPTTNPATDETAAQSSFQPFNAASEPLDEQPMNSFGAVDTQTISDSPYLHLGNDTQTSGQDNFSMYPDLQAPHAGEAMDTSVEHNAFLPDLMDPDDEQNQFINEAARAAVALDSSVNPNPFQQESVEGDRTHEQGFADQHMEDITTNGFGYEHVVQPQESQIDPSLLNDQPVDQNITIEQTTEEVVKETQLDRKPEMSEIRSHTSLISKNPFAALASASSDRGTSPAVTSPSHHANENESEADDGSATEREDETSILRQPDDDTFIPNGLIQDVLARSPNSNIPDAQPAAFDPTSFSSAAAPIEADHTSAPAADSSPPPPLHNATPKGKKSRPTPPALEVYQAPRTRSKSRDLSAPPTPSVTTRAAAAREGSAGGGRPGSRNGFVSPSPARSLRAGRASQGLGEMPPVEEEAEKQEDMAGALEGEMEPDDDVVEQEGAEDGAIDAGRDMARRALEVADDGVDGEDGEGEVDDDDTDAGLPEEGAASASEKSFSRQASRSVEGDEQGDDSDLEGRDGDGSRHQPNGYGSDAEADAASEVDANSYVSGAEDEEASAATSPPAQDEGEEVEVEEESEEDRGSYASGEEEEGYDDEDEVDGYDEDEEDDSSGWNSGYASRGLTPGQMQESGLIKGGTGQTVEDAFELSD